jgi:hypothetical protein
MMTRRLQTLGEENMKVTQYAKEAAAGPNRKRRVITPPTTPRSVVVKMSMAKADISIKVIQRGIW